MSKKYFPLINLLLLAAFLTPNGIVAQSVLSSHKEIYDGEAFERTLMTWNTSLEQVRLEEQARTEDFIAFQSFFQPRLDSMHGDFFKRVQSGEINKRNVKIFVAARMKIVKSLYEDFKTYMHEFPGSVDEFRFKPSSASDSCYPSCENIDFDEGNLNGWNGYWAVNSSLTNKWVFTSITGGSLGNVQKGAFDANTSSYQVHLTAGIATDWFLNTYSKYSMPQVSPYGGNYSCMIGDSIENGAGMAILTKKFRVTSAATNLTYEYSCFLENPNANSPHTYYQQPFFKVAVLDSLGDTIPLCGKYTVVSQQDTTVGGFIGIYYPPRSDSIYWKPWTLVNVPLKKYIGHCVTLVFEVGDCSLGGHCGYAYVDATCSSVELLSSSPSLCGPKPVTITAPPGEASYYWYTKNGKITGSNSSQKIIVDSAGTYSVICTPVTGALCADTLSIKITRAKGTPPIPSFATDTICAGQPFHFKNTSNPDSARGGSFYWDFYNIGTYNDSVANPTWVFNSPGNDTVKLHEVVSGCGTDTLIPIHIDTSVNGGFTASSACVGSTITFPNTSKGATSYYWNYGDNRDSLIYDTSSTVVTGSHTYNFPGTYTVTMKASNGGPCPDMVRQTITVYPIPKPKITGNDSICPGSSTTLTAFVTGGTGYVWNPGGLSGSSILVAPSVNTTYTCTASNSYCSGDSTFTVYLVKVPAVSITAKPTSICAGDSSKLSATGALKFLWSNGATDSIIYVKPSVSTKYKIMGNNGECTDTASVDIVVIPITHAKLSGIDSICPYDSTTLNVSGATSYLWEPGGSTSASITVLPRMSYTVYAHHACNTDTLTQTVNAYKLPVPLVKVTSPICIGRSDTLKASGATSYLWNTGATASTLKTGDLKSDTTFTLTVSNGKCIKDTTVTINVVTPPVVNITKTPVICPGEEVELKATAIGQGPFSYLWTTGTTGDTIFVSPTATTNYSVTVFNGCKKIEATAVVVDNPSLTGSAAKDTVYVTNTADTLYAWPGGGHYNYIWSPSTGVSCDTCRTTLINPAGTGTFIYTVTATDSINCPVSALVRVYVTIPCLDYKVPNVFTPGYAKTKDFLLSYIPIGDNSVEDLKYLTFSISIFDRWGKVVFKSNNPLEFWNGLIDNTGAECSDGVYYYVIQSSCNTHTYDKTGYVQLIRDK